MANQIWIACLASYNNGVLHGKWIDATTDVDEMQEAVNEVLRTSKYPNVMVEFEGAMVPSAEEYAIHDYNDEDGIFDGLGEYPGLQAVAARVELLEKATDELGDDGVKIVMAYWDHLGASYMPDDASDAVERAREAYQGTWPKLEDWAADFWESTGMVDQIPEALRNYFYYEAYGRDCEMSGDIFHTEDGFVFSIH